jgi:hypothetical protein
MNQDVFADLGSLYSCGHKDGKAARQHRRVAIYQ